MPTIPDLPPLKVKGTESRKIEVEITQCDLRELLCKGTTHFSTLHMAMRATFALASTNIHNAFIRDAQWIYEKEEHGHSTYWTAVNLRPATPQEIELWTAIENVDEVRMIHKLAG